MRMNLIAGKRLPAPPPFLKKMVGAGMRHCPFALKKQLLTPLLQTVFAQSVADGDLDFLRSRRIALRLDDFGECLQLSFDGRRLTPVAPTRTADVIIGGNSEVFLLLATRSVDPDALFFNRRLTIEGDTELGLAVKNWLDSLDEEQLPPWTRQLLALTRRWQTHAA